MASATNIHTDASLSVPPTANFNVESANQTVTTEFEQEAEGWASFLRHELQIMFNGEAPNPNTKGLQAPRRKHADPTSAALATMVASLLYPAPSDANVSQVIKYEKDIVLLRKEINSNMRFEAEMRLVQEEPTWKDRILKQGPWDEVKDPVSHAGAPSLPMPVEISDEKSLAPFFEHLSVGGTHDTLNGSKSKEAYYQTDIAEFEKGILYEDGRMDLCKKVLGPPNIANLMRALEENHFVKHFLLGNNMIGPVGAKAIAEFVSKHPDRIETWYLAGNCIDSFGLTRLVGQWRYSDCITNVWLKRNPLGAESAGALHALLTSCRNLRTLDLDQTELSDSGVAKLFLLLAKDDGPPLALRNLYLNAVGIAKSACEAIAMYLSSPKCTIESLYLSNNPLGDTGATALASGLQKNTSLLRLTLASCGINDEGARCIFSAMKGHPKLTTLIIGQNYATKDLGMRFNFLRDSILRDLVNFIAEGPKTLRMLDLGTTAMSLPALWSVAERIAQSKSIVAFNAKSVHGQVHPTAKSLVTGRLVENIAKDYRMDAGQFEAEERRWLISPKDVRLIDSGYRNRDTGLARRGQLILNKVWEDGFETLRKVMHADDDAESGPGIVSNDIVSTAYSIPGQ